MGTSLSRFTLKRFTTGLLPVVSMFILMLVSLFLISDAMQNATRFGRLYIWLLLLSTVLLVLFGVLIAFNLWQLVRQVIRKEPGSRLTLRFVWLFVVLALLPATVVYGFSVWLLHKGVDSWFDVEVEHALEDALDLSRASLDLQMRQLRQRTEPLAKVLADTPDIMTPLVLNDMLRASNAIEVSLFGNNSRVIASASEISNSILPRLPGDSVLRLVNQGETYVGLDPIKNAGLHIRLVFPVPPSPQNTENRILQVLYPVSDRLSSLAESVQAGFGKYQQLVYLRAPLKQGFIFTLTLILLSGVMFAIWAAFFSSRRLTAPITELAEGTRAVAAGEYHKRLPVTKRDDLGMLVMSFNLMTERLSDARDAADQSQRLVENQRTYLQTILNHLSSGVLSLDATLTLRTVNASASQILGLDLSRHVGQDLELLGREHPMLDHLCEAFKPMLIASHTDWQEQVNLFGPSGRKVLLCRGTSLPVGEGQPGGGHVIVFDDVTELIQAQRNAAWGEVARRLAHEIKNPLTPIQLSAERLRNKLQGNLLPQDAEILERSIHTIVQQVESMKTMVNAFGDYARAPVMEIAPLNLNTLIEELAELYKDETTHAHLQLDLDTDHPHIEADSVRIRQVLHNLIRNSLEAMENTQDARIIISSRCLEESGAQFVTLNIDDNGPGFPEDLMDRLFDPYITSKTKGNGLGLAIVKKIIEEHGGLVWALNSPLGACIRIRLLLIDVQKRSLSPLFEGNPA